MQKWTFFVLDFDATYDNEAADEDGVQPLVYIVPEDKVASVHHYARKAHDAFHLEKSSDLCIGDYFESYLDRNGIHFERVGSLNLTYGERSSGYLDEYTHIAYV